MLRQLGERARWGLWFEPGRGRVWAPAIGLAVGCAYFLAARLGLMLLDEIEGTAVLWPAAGVAAGALMTLGRGARAPVAVAVLAATVAVGLMAGRSLWAAGAFGLCNAGEALLTAWLVDRWCGRPFNFDDWRGLWGFLAAAALAAATAGVGGALVLYVDLYGNPLAPAFLDVWRLWAAADGLGIVTVAPLLVGVLRLADAPPSRRQALEGIAALTLTAATTGALFLSPPASWPAQVPASVLFPFLLWIAARCRPVFAAAAAFVISATLAGAVTFGVGQLGDATVTVPTVQVMILIGSLCAFSLSALFSERRRSEAALRDSNERLQLALGGAELGVWGVDLASGRFESDPRDGHINGHDPATPPRTLTEARRFIHPEDLPRLDAAFAAARQTGAPCRAEYRIRPAASRDFRHVRWVAVEGSVARDTAGRAVRLLGVTRDITERKLAEQALAERTAQLALAGQAGLVGSYAYDTASGMLQISAGFAAIYGLPEGTTEIRHRDWLTHVHPDDVDALEARRARAHAAHQPEVLWEYRIKRPDGEVRWIEQRSRMTCEAGAVRRVVGVQIDVTERKRDEEHKNLLLAELDHRVKNVLAVVSALITRSREAGGSAADVVAALDGRIKSMSTTHELLSGRKWQGLPLGELIRRELEPYATDSNVDLHGPDVVLKAEAGQALAMVVHELITNAAKYGALSVERGRVRVRWWRVGENGAGAHLVLEWRETDGPAVVPSSRVGYGTSVIRDLIPYELGGQAELTFRPEGARCRLEVPAKWLREPAGGVIPAGSDAVPPRPIADRGQTRRV